MDEEWYLQKWWNKWWNNVDEGKWQKCYGNGDGGVCGILKVFANKTSKDSNQIWYDA